MKWLTPLSALLLGATTISMVEGQGKDAPKGANYYPLTVGNEWHYKVTVGKNSNITVSTVAELETIDGVSLARLEMTAKDKIIHTEHLHQTAEGVFRHRNNGQKIVPPICLLKYPVMDGSTWDGPITVGKDVGKYFCEAKEETVKVKAGSFKAMRVTIEIKATKQPMTTTYWFVEDMGFVKQTVQTKQSYIVLELEKRVLAKK